MGRRCRTDLRETGVHLIRIQTGFHVGANTFEEQVAMYRCLAPRFPEFGRELDGLHILAVQGGALPGILTRTRLVTRLEDLKGLRIRAPTELLDVLDALGAAPVDMPMDEVYPALAKGVIDGVVAPPDTLKALRFASGVEFHSASAADQRRFDAIYDRSVSHSAHELERFGIDGASVYEDARSIAAGIEKTGGVHCDTSG